MKSKTETGWVVIYTYKDSSFVAEDSFSWRRKDAIKKMIESIIKESGETYGHPYLKQTIQKTWEELKPKGYSVQKISFKIKIK